MAKFKAKDIILLSAVQAAVGTPATPVDTDATLATEISYSDEISLDTQEYMGDSLSHDEENTVTDQYSKLSAKFFMPCLGATADLATIGEFLWTKWFQACGLKGAVSGTTPNQTVTFGNTETVSSVLTQDFLRSSSGIATQKRYRLTDAQGTVDLDLEIGKRLMLNFNMMGNYVKPTQETAIVADYGESKTLLGPTLNSSNIICSEITGLIGGFTHTGIGGSVKNICFTKISAPNLSGVSVDRLRTSCETGFDRSYAASDFTLTMLEKEAIVLGSESATVYDPYNHIQDTHKFSITIGSTNGSIVSIYWDKLQLTGISDTTYDKFAAKDLKFRNIGNVVVTLS